MNLEQSSNLLSTSNQATVSAGGFSYWQQTELPITVSQRLAQTVFMARRVATHKFTLVIVAVAAITAVILVSYAQVSDLRQKAHQAEIRRTSRIVVL